MSYQEKQQSEIISREEARERSLKRYYTGKPCKHGHDSEYTMNGDCVACLQQRQVKIRERKKQKTREKENHLRIGPDHLRYNDIITKDEAKDKGFTTFFTGVHCKNGHLSDRDFNGSCLQCKEMQNEIKRNANRRKSIKDKITPDHPRYNEIISKEEAIQEGKEFYFTGIPCKRGHLSVRRSINTICVECEQIKTNQYHKRIAPDHPYYKDIVSRDCAKEQNQRFYFTGVPCGHGHLSKRFTSSKGCVQCQRGIAKRNYEENKDEIRASIQKWKEENPEKLKATRQRNNRINSAKKAEWERNFRENYPETVKAKRSKYKRENKNKINADGAKRRAQKLRATPRWANNDKILEFYTEAQNKSSEYSERYVVDHIIPLNSDIVCGLHCEDNLRVITAKENEEKNNKVIEEPL